MVEGKETRSKRNFLDIMTRTLRTLLLQRKEPRMTFELSVGLLGRSQVTLEQGEH